MRPPFSPHPLQHLILLVNFLKMAILTSARRLHCSFHISPIMNNVGALFVYFLVVVHVPSPWRNVYLERPPVFSDWLHLPWMSPARSRPRPARCATLSLTAHWSISWCSQDSCAQFPLHSYCLSMILSFFKIHIYPSNTLFSASFQPLPLHINKPHHHLELNHIRNHESEQVTPWPQPTYSTLQLALLTTLDTISTSVSMVPLYSLYLLAPGCLHFLPVQLRFQSVSFYFIAQ